VDDVTHLQFVKVMQLHCSTKIKEHVGQIRTFGSQFMEDSVSDELDGKFDVSQGWTKSDAGIKFYWHIL